MKRLRHSIECLFFICINLSKITTVRLCPRENVTLTVGSVPAVSGVTPAVETVAPTVKNVKINISKHVFCNKN